MLRMIKEGDWRNAANILADADRLKQAIHWSVRREAEDARRRMVKGITSQAPGGKQFTPLSIITLIMRQAKGFKGKKALIVTAQLRNSITVKDLRPGMVWVGVNRNAQRADGKALFNIARVHELGATVTMRMTPKMHNYLMMMLRKAGYGRFKRTGRERFNKANWKITGRSNRIVVIRIPPRPFIQPVIDEMFADPTEVQRRLAKNIAYRMKFTVGRP